MKAATDSICDTDSRRKKNITKSDFVKFLSSKGIFTQVHYIPLIYQPYYKTQEMNKFHSSNKIL